jgi:hypothetical protein
MYAYQFWAYHLRLSDIAYDDSGAKIVKYVNQFFEESLLPWLEVLSIKGNLHVAIYSLHEVRSWLIDVSG